MENAEVATTFRKLDKAKDMDDSSLALVVVHWPRSTKLLNAGPG